jgi:hypothetical protein
MFKNSEIPDILLDIYTKADIEIRVCIFILLFYYLRQTTISSLFLIVAYSESKTNELHTEISYKDVGSFIDLLFIYHLCVFRHKILMNMLTLLID